MMDAASRCKTLHCYFRNSSRIYSSSSITEPLPRKGVHDSVKEHDHTDVHDDDSDILITSVEGPSSSTTVCHMRVGKLKRKVGRPKKMVPETTVEKPRVPCPPVRVPRPSTKKGADKDSAGENDICIRQLYSSAQKAKITRYSRFHGSRAAARHFGVHHKNCQRWLKEEWDQKRRQGKHHRNNQKGQGRKVSYPKELEDQLVKWILKKREQSHIPVSKEMIRLKGLSLIKPTLTDFNASQGWLSKFLARHNLVLRARTSIAQTLPCDLEEKIAQFRQSVQYVRQNGDFQCQLIANMDETPVYFDLVPSKSVDVKGKKSIRVRTTKSEKKHITAVLSCAATGDMLLPMIIFKGKTTRSIYGVRSKEGAVITHQQKAWMDEDIMKQWINKVWIVYTKKRPSLLILDSFSAHTTEGIKSMFERFNTTVIVIPGGCTSVLQPLDVSVNRPFKDQLKKCWEEYMLEQSDLLSDAEKIKPPTKQHIVDWIDQANKKLHQNATIVKKSFLVTGLSNALGRHEDDQIRNDLVQKEIDEILTEVFGEHSMGFTSNSMESTTDPFESDTTMSSEDSASARDHECTSDLSSVTDSDHSVSAPEFKEISDLEADPPSC